MLKLALSEHGLIQLCHLFGAAEERCERRYRELLQLGDYEGAAREAERRRDYADMKQRILKALRDGRPPSRLQRIAGRLRSLCRCHLPSLARRWRWAANRQD